MTADAMRRDGADTEGLTAEADAPAAEADAPAAGSDALISTAEAPAAGSDDLISTADAPAAGSDAPAPEAEAGDAPWAMPGAGVPLPGGPWPAEGPHLAYVGLGSNLGDGPALLAEAVGRLARGAGRVAVVSPLMESEAWGYESPHRYTNAVCALLTRLGPDPLLDVMQAIERAMGRTARPSRDLPYADRLIDLDLLTYDDLRLSTPRLILPHPHIDRRPFVSLPLAWCRRRMERGS